MSNAVTIYVTKYALTSGILVVDGEIRSSGGYRYRRSSEHYVDYVYGSDVHLTKEGALERAEEMRIAKVYPVAAPKPEIKS